MPPSALRTRAARPKKTVRFAPDTKETDTSDLSARKYRRPSTLLFAPPPKPKPAPQRQLFRADYHDAIASRDRMTHISRSWMY
jgi:hypothetical protein